MISGTFHSEDRENALCRIRSDISTARKSPLSAASHTRVFRISLRSGPRFLVAFTQPETSNKRRPLLSGGFLLQNAS